VEPVGVLHDAVNRMRPLGKRLLTQQRQGHRVIEASEGIAQLRDCRLAPPVPEQIGMGGEEVFGGGVVGLQQGVEPGCASASSPP
jgi:hypothetical protein